MVLIGLLIGAAAASAQTFDSGSTGADGALDYTGESGTIIFNPNTHNPPLDPEHDNVYNFTTITIPSGVTLRLGADILGSNPIVWLATGAVTVSGTIDLNGGNGHNYCSTRIESVAGAGGYGGGRGGGETNGSPEAGSGPGGGRAAASGIGTGGGGGYAAAGGANSGAGNGAGGAAYGNVFLLPLLGGSGGAGTRFVNGNCNGSGGGAGGGALLIAASGAVSVAGSIKTDGGVGYNGTAASVGGGGSGGAIRMIAPSVTVTGTLYARGGGAAGASNVGSSGYIRIEGFQRVVSGATINPGPSLATPGVVFLPPTSPFVRMAMIGGIAVPQSPTGSCLVHEVIMNSPSPVSIGIQAHSIPLGTVVHLTLYNETLPAINVDSTPLAGTVDASTATAQVTIPYGFSRFFVQASWTP